MKISRYRWVVALAAAGVAVSALALAQTQAQTPTQAQVSPAPAVQAAPLRRWSEYEIIMWTGDSAYKKPEKLPVFWKRLREMGVTAGMVHGDGDLRPLLEEKVPYYVENMVNKGLCLKFSSNVRDWDKFVTAWKSKRDEAGCVRDYCFDDPQWRGWARKEVESLVKKNAPHAPLLYNLRDELSVTQSANPFDYDFAPAALAGFRKWLEGRYHTLAALNAEWETQFKTWDEVKPFTTDRIKNRMASGDAWPRGNPDWQAVQKLKFQPFKLSGPATRWNFAPWADHRTYMDVSLAGMLDELRRTAHALDQWTPVGIEGTQMPSAFGGYDLWRLSQSLDWVEPYDVCGARAIFGSFMPGRTFLTTVGEQDAAAARRRLWHLLLEGDRGCLIWWSEDSIDWKSDDYALTPRAKALIPVLQEMRGPLAQLIFQATRERDPIAIHYSQPSVQAAWLIESVEDGSTWLRRFSSYEAARNLHAKVRMNWMRTLENAGYSPVYLSSEQIEQGALAKFRTLVLPRSYALSDREAAEIGKFLAPAGATVRNVLADGYAGFFDEHCRLRPASALAGPLKDRWVPNSEAPENICVTTSQPRPAFGSLAFDMQRLDQPAPTAWLRQCLSDLPPAVEVPVDAEVRVTRHRLGAARLLAFEQNHVYQMGEDLKDKGATRKDPVTFTANLREKGHVYDLREEKYLGETDHVRLTVAPEVPTILAVTKTKLPEGDPVAALQKMAGGE